MPNIVLGARNTTLNKNNSLSLGELMLQQVKNNQINRKYNVYSAMRKLKQDKGIGKII